MHNPYPRTMWHVSEHTMPSRWRFRTSFVKSSKFFSKTNQFNVLEHLDPRTVYELSRMSNWIHCRNLGQGTFRFSSRTRHSEMLLAWWTCISLYCRKDAYFEGKTWVHPNNPGPFWTIKNKSNQDRRSNTNLKKQSRDAKMTFQRFCKGKLNCNASHYVRFGA